MFVQRQLSPLIADFRIIFKTNLNKLAYLNCRKVGKSVMTGLINKRDKSRALAKKLSQMLRTHIENPLLSCLVFSWCDCSTCASNLVRDACFFLVKGDVIILLFN